MGGVVDALTRRAATSSMLVASRKRPPGWSASASGWSGTRSKRSTSPRTRTCPQSDAPW